MGLLANLKMIWKNRAALKAASNAADGVKEAYVKSGWKTTEFWLAVLSNIATVVPALGGLIPPEKAATILAVVNGLYGIVRALTKAAAAPSA
jgi:hypothetical protein